MKTTLRVVQEGNPKLRIPATPVTEFDGHLFNFARRMELAMRAARGIGLAANQIGGSYAMFVTCAKGKSTTHINPRLLDASTELVRDLEGCLSIAGKSFMIPRPLWVTFEYENLDGNTIAETWSENLARVFFHEYDHLAGKLISDWQDDNDEIPSGKRTP